MEVRHDQIANEIIIASMVLETNNVSTIAAELKYSPLLLINALYAGTKVGKFKYHSKRDTITISEDVEPTLLPPTEEMLVVPGNINLKEEIVQLITNLNQDEKDLAVEELMGWIPGSNATQLKMIAYLCPELALYKLADPKDKKSVYTFLTLKENVDKQFGLKQFKKK